MRFILAFCLFFMVGQVFATSNAPLTAELVIVHKAKRTLSVYVGGKAIRKFRIALGSAPMGHKLKEGDQRTPEGRYILDYKKDNSDYYRAIHISYPNEADRLRSKALGVNPGGQIMIHGQNPQSKLSARQQQRFDWTNGCIAITNKQMDVLWQLVAPGTPIEIWP